jgi:hypothetical protein
MEKEGRKVYQIMDGNGKYRSKITIHGESVEFISRDKKEAIVYTLNEAKELAKYYIDKDIPVLIECRTVYTKFEI